MSAIAGIFNFESDHPVISREIERMGGAIAVHGPDVSNQWIQGSFGVAHRLLQITPEDSFERQPLCEGPLVLTADIRLDNREDLAAAFGLSSLEANRLPDSALLLKAYQKWGVDCVERLTGAFAFALWDEQERKLIIARDQLGQKTLFYHKANDFFAFASMPKGLFALDRIPRRLNEGQVAEFLTLNHRDYSNTFYEGVSRLPPAHVLIVSRKGVQLKRYWALDPNKRIELSSDQAYVERAQELLETCIKASLRSESPVGAMMSGGLDSSTVACVAARQLAVSGERLPVYTEVPQVGFGPKGTKSRYYDETPYVEAIREMNPTLDVTYVRSEGRSLFNGHDKRYALFESPQRNVFNHIWMDGMIELAASRGNRVLLGGQRGNMSLSYNGLHQLPEWARDGHWLKLLKAVCQIPKHTSLSPRSVLMKAIAPLCPESVWRARTRFQSKGQPAWHTFSAINPSFAADADIDERNRATGHDSTFRSTSNGRIARMNVLEGGAFMGDISQYFGGAFRVELRDPLGDIRLLEFCLAIPEDQYLRGGKTRWLLRRMMEKVLPPLVLNNKRRGLQIADWVERMDASKAKISSELAALKDSDTARRILDLDRMQTLHDKWSESDWQSPESLRNYRLLLARGIEVGRFIRWFEGDTL